MQYWFTSDEHYNHSEMLQYREGIDSVEKMNQSIIDNHNRVVKDSDTTIHGGDFTLVKDPAFAMEIIRQLNGQHIFIKGSHDYWIDRDPNVQADYMWEKTFKYPDKKRYFISIGHYPMRSWRSSHYPCSWQLFGHHHGQLRPYGLQYDISADTNSLFPYSMDDIIKIMEPREALYNLALPVFGDSYKRTWDWLTEPAKALGDEIPINFLETPNGLTEIKNILGRIEHGVYS